ncbi:MAG: transposase, partial [Candidatus Atribacteria bacterium]|nr:transposase [Candidatus Atribacteria bacterium]
HHLEELVTTMAQATNFGPKRLGVALARAHGVFLSPSTIRNILRRHSIRCRKYRTGNGGTRYGVNLAAFRPLEFWQIDVKDIADQKALPPSAYASIFRERLPRYQFTACEVRTRIRFIAYAHELSFLSGCAFLLLLTFWLRSFGVQRQLLFQTDNGTEFGGLGNSRKRLLMQRYIFDPLGVTLLAIPPREKTVNTFVERSHRTDDEEFYALNLGKTTTKHTFLSMAQEWILTYNFRRPHFGRGMRGRTPMEVLLSLQNDVHPALGAFPVLLLDRVLPHLKVLWDISGIPWDNSPKNKNRGLANETLDQYIFEREQ